MSGGNVNPTDYLVFLLLCPDYFFLFISYEMTILQIFIQSYIIRDCGFVSDTLHYIDVTYIRYSSFIIVCSLNVL